MVLREYTIQDGWLLTRWQLTYKLGWKGSLYVCEAMYPYLDRGEVLVCGETEGEENLTAKVIDADKKVISLLETERRYVTVRGISQLLKYPLQMTLFNQTNVCEVSIPQECIQDFATCENQYQRIVLELGLLLDSAEVLGHVWMSK